MAITINGTGTIGGITAGGLPDACVTAADLAVGVGGKVLQVVSFRPTNDQTITTAALTTIPGWNFTVNKVSANSKVICFMQYYQYYSSAPSYWWVRAYANGTPIVHPFENAVSTHNSMQYAFGVSAHQEYTPHFHDNTPAATVVYTFAIQQQSPGTFTLWGAAGHQFTFMEIAQ